LILATVSILLAISLAESLARLLGLGRPVYAPRRFEPTGSVPFTTLGGQIPVYQPNTTFWSVHDPAGDQRGYFGPKGRVTYRLNRFGIRSPDYEDRKAPGTLRVVCLGDSFTFAEGVHYGDSYAARLENLLARSGQYEHVEVINAGVQAYGTKEAVAFFLLRGRQFEPDIVTLGFVLNDATDFAETVRQNEARTRDVSLSLVGRTSRLWEILERGRRARHLQNEFFETIRRSFRSAKWDECRDLLKGMEQLSREDNFRFVVVLFPIFWELDGDYPFENLHALVAGACRQADCEFIDLLEVYRGRQAQSLWVHPTDQHPNEIAHRLAAERIAEYLAEETR
jgi:lysophospholipase L1-like esterase